MDQVNWKVEGMTCSNCALSISKYLQKEGMENVNVNPIDGSVSFLENPHVSLEKIKKGIHTLGYHVSEEEKNKPKSLKFSDNRSRFLFSLPFTLLLMLHMAHPWLHIPWIMNPFVQLALCVPVFWIGMRYFGKSAWKSIVNGMPNMNVLVALGALAAFIYSAVGAFYFHDANYYFFETTATIITLVFLGNYLEEASVQYTQSALKTLVKSQRVIANMIAFDENHQEQIFPIDNTQLKTGDLILIKTGEQIPIDCKILWGEGAVNEAIITGESVPVLKTKKDFLIGGSVLESGAIKAQVTATGKETVLSGIIQLVQHAQSEKPPMQKLADKISAVFVPIVIVIAVITLIANYYLFDVSFSTSLMRSIAVLVISCPCAMGLATPAAIAVGLGRAARNGILFRNASSLESFKSIRQIVFDKTGTLTTGKFSIHQYHTDIDEKSFKQIVYSLEKYSNHPIAKSIASHWKTDHIIRWSKAEEIKGLGIRATDTEGHTYEAGSYQILSEDYSDKSHHIYVLKNGKVIGWIDIKDEIRPEAKKVIDWLHNRNIKTIILTGDIKTKAEEVANKIGINEIYAEQRPEQKMEMIGKLNAEMPTAMVGDGINDAPALAKASLGIAVSEASQLALQHADVVLMNNSLSKLPEALGLGKHTLITIKQNLFWAFAYNVVAIPIAAAGLLTPGLSALAMGLSDVVLGVNSVRLFVKKVL
ncbi:MAG: cadmium-translocating P-type ATPase [Ferruginibacter sp.]|nr:cadmium-translocating P-type ATPase [Ferruginibacter sp.]